MTCGRKNHGASECLGRIDEAIVDVLRCNGRITYKKLASLVHLSESPCQQRVRKLERLGVIRGYGAFIDEHKLSPGLFLVVLVTLAEGRGSNTQKAFEALISASPQVIECHLVSGALDYCLRMRCRDMEHFRSITECWFESTELHIEKLAAYPQLAVIKPSSMHLGIE
ncbi:Lrp/AsnC family transcriptional regulator [Pseudomonas sp. S3E12]|uniref:Lrp/AsnC family transcriptional regulator n=1 Tax=Pseudomonas sp. S3E12 TaxID=1873126 RepID=UPI00081BD147|nr:Lrp/AsnC family transcriptional regulator [Pseudomonas sp. S3E12]OCW20553.1 AsnC family transcriptional regulator [Pseudomonas sp. S3E12]